MELQAPRSQGDISWLPVSLFSHWPWSTPFSLPLNTHAHAHWDILRIIWTLFKRNSARDQCYSHLLFGINRESPGDGLGDWVCLWGTRGTCSAIIPEYQTSSWMDKLTPHCVCACSALAKHKHGLVAVYTAAVECRAKSVLANSDTSTSVKLLPSSHANLLHKSWCNSVKGLSASSFIQLFIDSYYMQKSAWTSCM